jgi:hypothetical protein
MKCRYVVTPVAMIVLLGVALFGGAVRAVEQASPDQHVAALKKSLQQSQARLHDYEWIETTIISLKGEEKGRKVKRCYYGADGKLEKLPVDDGSAQPPPQQSGGRGGRLKQKIVENKKDEMQDYMERAAALVHQYVPPNPERIQSAKDAGKLAVRPADAGRVRIDVTDYLQPGDRLGLDLDAAADRLLGLSVNTYLDKPEDVVALNVSMGSLADGTSFAEQTTLDATAKKIRVMIQNAGYRPMSR